MEVPGSVVPIAAHPRAGTKWAVDHFSLGFFTGCRCFCYCACGNGSLIGGPRTVQLLLSDVDRIGVHLCVIISPRTPPPLLGPQAPFVYVSIGGEPILRIASSQCLGGTTFFVSLTRESS